MAAAPSIQCPTCKGWIAADPRFAGQRVACPHCQGQLIMPGGGIAFRCPYCGYQGPPSTKKKTECYT
jgi:DNA-directed RNA polymerase subunit RPC12/RpoP